MVILKEKEIGDAEENIGAVGQGGYHRGAPWLWGMLRKSSPNGPGAWRAVTQDAYRTCVSAQGSEHHGYF